MKMDDYIKREEAIMTAMDYDGLGNAQDASQDIAAALASIPAADVRENVLGKWEDMGDFEQCSACNGTHLKEFQSYYGKTIWIKTPFCQNCGADMRGEQDG